MSTKTPGGRAAPSSERWEMPKLKHKGESLSAVLKRAPGLASLSLQVGFLGSDLGWSPAPVIPAHQACREAAGKLHLRASWVPPTVLLPHSHPKLKRELGETL